MCYAQVRDKKGKIMGRKGKFSRPRKTPKFERRKKEIRGNFKTLNEGHRAKNPKKLACIAKKVIGPNFFKKKKSKRPSFASILRPAVRDCGGRARLRRARRKNGEFCLERR
jgi:hypothetical protein